MEHFRDCRLSEIYFGYYARWHAYRFFALRPSSLSVYFSKAHRYIAPPVRVWREVWHDGERAPGIFRQATVWYALFVLDVAAVATVVPVTARCPPRYRYALSATRCVCIVHSCYVTLVIVCASSLHACMEKGRTGRVVTLSPKGGWKKRIFARLAHRIRAHLDAAEQRTRVGRTSSRTGPIALLWCSHHIVRTFIAYFLPLPVSYAFHRWINSRGGWISIVPKLSLEYVSRECQFYRFNFASARGYWNHNRRINRYAVAKFVRSPGENNKRTICKRASVDVEGQRGRTRASEGARRGGEGGGTVYIFQIEMLTR